MKVHWLALLLVIGAALAVPVVSAQTIDSKSGYIVTPGHNAIKLPKIAPLTSSSISQGQSQYYTSNVPSGKTAFYADLNWGNSANSLRLIIIAPDASFGPFYDSADGQVDGRINIVISRTWGIASGAWYSQVYGDQVTGVQSYTYSVGAS